MRQYHDLLRRVLDESVPSGTLAMVGQGSAATALFGQRTLALAQYGRGE
jgi:hypothetical protein